jgi:hypothetical protein
MAYFDGLKVGDRVWEIKSHWGFVDEILNTYLNPIKVVFKNRGYGFYRMDGRCSEFDLGQILFWDEIKIVPPPRPKCMVTKEGWINIYKENNFTYIGDSISRTKEEADHRAYPGRLISTIKIIWQEEE